MLRNLQCLKHFSSFSKFVSSERNSFEVLQDHRFTSSYNFHKNSLLSAVRLLHISPPRNRGDDKRSLISSGPKKDDGTSGEKAMNIDVLIQSRRDMFPNEETPNMLFKGIPFCEVPIVNIRVSRNNTIFSLTEANGEVKIYRSCGIEGFKNTRKGTNIAAQATAITFTSMVLNKGFKTVRVRVQGLGAGRMSSVKGLQMGGLDIISVTDSTRVSENPPRPRKRRRL